MSESQGAEIIALLNQLILFMEAFASASGDIVIMLKRVAIGVGFLCGMYLFRMFLLSKNQKTIIALLVSCFLTDTAFSQTETIIDNTGITASSGKLDYTGGGYYGSGVSYVPDVGQWMEIDVPGAVDGEYTIYYRWCDFCVNDSTSVIWQVIEGDGSDFYAAGVISNAVPPTASEVRGTKNFQQIATFTVEDGQGFAFRVVNNTGTNGKHAKLDAIMFIRAPDPGPECDGTIWPGHPDYVGGKPAEWADSYVTRAGAGNLIGELDGAENTWTYSGGAGYDISAWGVNGLDYEWYEAGGGYIADNGYMIFLTRYREEETDPWDYTWVIGKPGEQPHWQDTASACVQFGGTYCPTYPPCCAAGHFLEVIDIESEVCNVEGGEPDGGSGCCCGAQTTILEQIRDAIEEEQEEPGETFSGTTPELQESPIYVPTHALPAISSAVKSWDIPIDMSYFGISQGESTFTFSTALAYGGPIWEKIANYWNLIRLAMLWMAQAWYYGRILDILRAF